MDGRCMVEKKNKLKYIYVRASLSCPPLPISPSFPLSLNFFKPPERLKKGAFPLKKRFPRKIWFYRKLESNQINNRVRHSFQFDRFLPWVGMCSFFSLALFPWKYGCIEVLSNESLWTIHWENLVCSVAI